MTISHRIGIAMTLLVCGPAAASPAQPARVQADGPITVVELRTEDAANPIGIDVRELCASAGRFVRPVRLVQTAYQLQVATSEAALRTGKGLVWDSGVAKSGDSVNAGYAGPALASGQRCFWRVRVWDGAGKPSPWSDAAPWEMGLLRPADWKASWIEPVPPRGAQDL